MKRTEPRKMFPMLLSASERALMEDCAIRLARFRGASDALPLAQVVREALMNLQISLDRIDHRKDNK